MKDLIKITEKEGRQVVSARELHEFLVQEAKGGQKGEDFSNWIKRMISYLDSKDGTDYTTIEYDYMGNVISKFSETDNQLVTVYKRDYVLSIDMAKEVSMIQNNDKGKQARKYFIECEKIAKGEILLPKTFAEALQLAANQAKELEEKNKQLEFKDTIISEYEPKANYYDIILSSKDAINISIIAKDYGLSAKTMNKKLHDLGVIYKSGDTWLPYQKYSSQGYTKTTTIAYNDGDGSAVHSKWTQKGRLFLYDLLKNNGVLPLVEQ